MSYIISEKFLWEQTFVKMSSKAPEEISMVLILVTKALHSVGPIIGQLKPSVVFIFTVGGSAAKPQKFAP